MPLPLRKFWGSISGLSSPEPGIVTTWPLVFAGNKLQFRVLYSSFVAHFKAQEVEKKEIIMACRFRCNWKQHHSKMHVISAFGPHKLLISTWGLTKNGKANTLTTHVHPRGIFLSF